MALASTRSMVFSRNAIPSRGRQQFLQGKRKVLFFGETSRTLFSGDQANVTLFRRIHSLRLSSLASLSKQQLGHQLQQQQQQRRLLGSNPVSSVSSWLRDVIQTKNLQPPNPILQSIQNVRQVLDKCENYDEDESSDLVKRVNHYDKDLAPRFAFMLPYHLELAAQEVQRQYQMELAQLEVSLTAATLSEPDETTQEIVNSIVHKLDRLEAPIYHVLQIGHMLSQLVVDHEDLREWNKAHSRIKDMLLNKVALRDSHIVYNAIVSSQLSVTTTTSSGKKKNSPLNVVPPNLLKSFCLRGAQYSDTSSSTATTREQLQDIQFHILLLKNDIGSVNGATFTELSKSAQLQVLSDLYQIIGLTWQQARLLGYDTACQMELDDSPTASNPGKLVGSGSMTSSSHMLTSANQIHDLHQDVASVIEPYVKKTVEKLDPSIVQGGFLGGSNSSSSQKMMNERRQYQQQKEERRILWHARHAIKDYLTLDGVMKGIFDWTHAILGISIEEEIDDFDYRIHGWQQNVRLFHVYYNPLYEETETEINNETTNSSLTTNSVLLGSFYMDPYERSAKPYVPSTWLFSQRSNQTTTPIVMMSLCMESPAWSDDPTLLTWDTTRSLLYNFGKALQLILTASSSSTSPTMNQLGSTRHVPVDVSEFLPHFMELWLHSDGFVQRLCQLSQEEYDFIPHDLLELLRKHWAQQKIEDWRQQIYLGELELAIWNEVDPLGGTDNKEGQTANDQTDSNSSHQASSQSLGELQQRLAKQYTPNSVPSSQDLSPLLEVIQGSGSNAADTTMSQDFLMTTYTSLLSEVLSANVYEAFQEALTANSVVRDDDDKSKDEGGDTKRKNDVQRLGRGVRELFLRSTETTTEQDETNILSVSDFQTLCGGREISPTALERVFKLSELDKE